MIEIRLPWVAQLDASSQHVMVAASAQPVHGVDDALSRLRLALRSLVWINAESGYDVMAHIRECFDKDEARTFISPTLARTLTLTLHETRTMIRALRIVAGNHPHDLVRIWAVEHAQSLYRLLEP